VIAAEPLEALADELGVPPFDPLLTRAERSPTTPKPARISSCSRRSSACSVTAAPGRRS
jgi:hypothetical protein